MKLRLDIEWMVHLQLTLFKDEELSARPRNNRNTKTTYLVSGNIDEESDESSILYVDSREADRCEKPKNIFNR